MSLDRSDRAILRVLQDDGRIPVTALAERIGLSPNATAERLRRMQREGVIAGFRAVLSAAALGRGLTAFVEVIRQVADVEECHMVAGGFDYLLKTRHRDMAAYRAFLSERLLDLPGVRETRTYAVMEAVIEGAPMPLE